MTNYFHRYVTEKIKISLKDSRIIILIGSRQVGKTMIIKNIFENVLTNEKNKFYFNFEKAIDLEIFENVDNLEKYLNQFGTSLNKKVFLAIDEFHYLKNATKFFKIIFDEYPSVKILASGSSSIEIQKHLKESLAGRKKIYYVFPLSFEEYLLATKRNALWQSIKLDNALSYQINKINTFVLEDYLVWGGYPRLAEKHQKNRELKKEELFDIYNSYIQKDIKALIKGENILAFNNLVKILASQIGNLLNINELSKTLRISRYEVEKYLMVLQETYIIKKIPAFYRNKRKEITKMPKIYFYDLGICNMALSNFGPIATRPNLGAIIENFVLTQMAHFLSVSDQIFFWRTLEGGEIDFVLVRDGALIPIEVKWSHFDKPVVPINLLNFVKKNKGIKESWIITKNYLNKTVVNGIAFSFIPACLLIKKMKGAS